MITDPTLIEKFIFAGNATFTLRSTKTGTRFTYKVQQGDGEGAPWFVKVLTGADNECDYRYAGCIFADNRTFVRKGKKGMDPKAPSMVALNWYLKNIGDSRVEFFHQDSCAACGRALTVPESIATGFGPVCAEKHGVVYADYMVIDSNDPYDPIDGSSMLTAAGLERYDLEGVKAGLYRCQCDGHVCVDPGSDNVACTADRIINVGTRSEPTFWAVSNTCYHEQMGENHEAQMRSQYELDYYSGRE